MTAWRVAVAGTLFLLVAAVVLVVTGTSEVVAGLSWAYDPSALMPLSVAGIVIPTAAIGVALLLRRRRRTAWILLLGAAWIATTASAMGWVSRWPIVSADSASHVELSGTSAHPVALAAGMVHACAMLDDGTVWCWGSNSGGQLDTFGSAWGEPPEERASAAPVPDVSGATTIAASGHLTCVIASGRLQCWGDTPIVASGGCVEVRVFVAGGESSFCNGITSELPAVGWPYGAEAGSLETLTQMNCNWSGDGPRLCSPLPTVTSGASSLALADDHGCVVADRRVWCWGLNTDGQLGAGAQPASTDANPLLGGWGGSVAGIDAALAVSVGSNATCASLAPDSTGRRRIKCWGTAAYQAFGLPVPRDTSLPFDVAADAVVSAYPVDPWPLCGPDPAANDAPAGCDRFVRAPAPDARWVVNTLNTQVPAGVPMPVTAVTSMWDSSCAVAAGSVWCWGLDMGGPVVPFGQFNSAHPVAGLSRVTSIAAGGSFTCAIADGAVRCWGLASSGQLGQPNGAGVPDLLALTAWLALALVAAAGGFAAVRIFQVETRRRASVAFGAEVRGRVALASLQRLAVAALLTLGAWVWLYASSSSGSLVHYPLTVALAAAAGVIGAIASDARDRGIRRRISVVAMLVAAAGGAAVAAVFTVPTIAGVFTSTLPQPVAASPLVETVFAVPLALVGLLVYYLPPVDPLLARDFGVQYREVRTARRQLSLLLHPWRFLTTRAAEKERARLAAELHAGVLPGLYRSLKEVEGGGSVERLALDLREAVEDVEGMLARRRSIVLEEVGLLGAVEWLAERTEERSTVTVEIDVEGASDAARAPRAVERAAFRVAQLALDNCAKHAPRCTAKVRLGASPTRVTLVISDDGPGLTQTPAEAVMAGRNGLADMDDEARGCGARLAITSSDATAERPGVTVSFEWKA